MVHNFLSSDSKKREIMKKRIIIGIVSFMMLLSACGNTASQDNTQNKDTQNTQVNIETEQEDTANTGENTDTNNTDTAVGESTSSESQNTDGEVQELQSLQQIYEEITASVELCSPMLITDEILLNYYNINAEDLDEYVFEMSEDATSAEMVVMMKILDSAKMEEVKTNLETELSYKKYELEDYLPEEYEIVNSAVVKTDGEYLWLVVSHKEAQISEIIEKYL